MYCTELHYLQKASYTIVCFSKGMSNFHNGIMYFILQLKKKKSLILARHEVHVEVYYTLQMNVYEK